jgi:hypothetical protein
MPTWQSFPFTERSTVLSSSPMHSYAPTQCSPGRALRILNDSISSELTTEFFLCALLAPAQCPLGRALRILNDSVSSELTTEFFLCALLAPAQCPLGRALQNSQQNSVCNYVFSHTALPPEVFNNLKRSSS